MTQNQEREALGAFAGLVVLVAILTILFVLTTPGLRGGPTAAAEGEVAAAPTEAPTEIEPTVAPTEVEPTTAPTEVPTNTPQPEPTDAPPTEAQDTEAVSAGDYDPEVVTQGEQLFVSACSACHGVDARGIQGLGKDLVDSEFVTTTDDDALVDFVTMGRPIWDPANTTGVDMPPKGGNPALTEDDLYAIVAYLRTLQN